MATKSRSQIIMATDTVQLKAQFRDSTGANADLDSLPTVTINQPSGNIAVGPTSSGVIKLDTGLYAFEWEVGLNPALGVYSDIWDGTLNGMPIRGEFNFIIHETQMPFVNSDGYEALGDDPGFNYSQEAIHNINLLLKSLRARLDSRGKSRIVDDNGNDVYVDCDIFSVEQMVSFLAISLSMFNETAHFTLFTFEDSDIIAQFHEVIVQGATIYALASKSLLERGREFDINDTGVSFTPPGVSDIMSTQYSVELTQHYQKLTEIKAHFKPFPLGLGTFHIGVSRHPAIARLRHLRSRQII